MGFCSQILALKVKCGSLIFEVLYKVWGVANDYVFGSKRGFLSPMTLICVLAWVAFV